jgi:hypothetical protein
VTFSVRVWTKSPAGNRLSDARQIKFLQAYCAGFFPKDSFLPFAKSERHAFFREILDRTPPAGLDADLPALGYEAKVYSMPPFRKVRLTHRAMKCDGRGGEAYELNFFP